MATSKTTKKVQTPVDERETFVSLRKSFVEGEQSIEEKLQTLLELQKADNEIEKLVQLRGELPGEVSALENEIESVRSKRAHLDELVVEYANAIENYKQQIVDVDAEIVKYRDQLDKITNSREFDSLNKEIENQEILRQINEKNINEAYEAISARKEDIARLDEKLAIREEDLKAKNEELATIVESTSKEEAQLQAKRDACAAKIDERTMSAYNRIRSSVHNHLAVVPVFNGACGGCFNTITPQRLLDVASGKKLVICEHCGRIIVNAEN